MTFLLDRSDLDALLDAIRAQGRRIIGPTVEHDAIVYATITSTSDLPVGISDLQSRGAYDLIPADHPDRLFGYVVGPDSMKRTLHPPELTLFRAIRRDGSITFEATAPDPEPLAFFGVRACDIAAARIQDTVFLEGPHRDDTYAANRSRALIIAVDCSLPSTSCFCTSMGGGPAATDGFDIAMTEVEGDEGFRYVCRAGSGEGATLLAAVATETGAADLVEEAERIVANAAAMMPVRVDPDAARMALATGQQSSEWASVAERCLACGNCTAVCPTCFCTTVTDHTDLAGGEWTRRRVWDSCFTLEFSAVHRVPVRASVAARYRQWISHKLSTWYDQFGTTGCVGCGRCITWCPVGIDLIAEVAALERRKESVS